MPRLPLALASTLFALLTGCAAMTQDADAPGLDGTAWMLSTLPGQSLLPGHPATLFFDAGRAQGSDGCNRYGTSYTVDGSKLAVSTQGASTRMAWVLWFVIILSDVLALLMHLDIQAKLRKAGRDI